MTNPKIAIIDYGAGNLRSVARAVSRTGYEAKVTASPSDALAADAVILPGVGAAADTMRNLTESGLVEPVREAIAWLAPLSDFDLLRKKPVVCTNRSILGNGASAMVWASG